MSKTMEDEGLSLDHGSRDGHRRHYKAPRIVESGAFEHLVLACAFAPNTSCQFLPGGAQY